MSEYFLPKSVEINGIEHKIRNDCDYRVIIDVIAALNDEEIGESYRYQCALFIFYEDLSKIDDLQLACEKMIEIVSCGKREEEEEEAPLRLICWEHDCNNISPPISRTLGYSVRDERNYTHWYDFIGAYMEIGKCYFAEIVSIRKKKLLGKKLDKTEREFYKEHRKDIDFPMKLSMSAKEWLDGDW